MLRLLRECDLFRKLSAEHREAAETPVSASAGVLRFLSLLLIAWLSLSELGAFITPVRKQRFDIDMDGLVNIAEPRKMRVMLNITIHDFPCVDLSLDYQDVIGTKAVDVRTTIFKQRLHPNGTQVGTFMMNDPKSAVIGGASGPSIVSNTSGNVTCGTCYGALPPGHCCNTCSDVLYAYRVKRWALPRIETIEQCKNDGTANSAYQPPQIIHTNDYSSDDYISNFKKVGSITASGNEARISTPFRFNFTLTPLKFNFSEHGKNKVRGFDLDNSWDDYWDDYDEYGGDLWPSSKQKNNDKVIVWPNCIKRNVIVNGYDFGEALMLDLTAFGAKEGCWKENCSSTDKFNCDSIDHCATVCSQVEACHWWTWGLEDFAAKCWLRRERHGRGKRYGFSSGQRNCTPSATTTPLVEAKEASSTSTSIAVVQDQVPPAASSSEGSVETSKPEEVRPRRLMSLDDDDFYSSRPFTIPFGPSLHMPMFGSHSTEKSLREEQRGESCRIHGYFDTNRVPGNFHIGSHGPTVPAYLSLYEEPAPEQKNMRHTINSLGFVEVSSGDLLNKTQPLDGFESPKAFTFQYYLTITPATLNRIGTSLKGYQFRSASFVTNELIGPAVFFRMDMDPIRVTYYTEEVRWSKLVVSVCAAVGGCVALCAMLTQLVENFTAAVQGKD